MALAVEKWELACRRAPYAENWRLEWANASQRSGDLAGALHILHGMSDSARNQWAPFSFLRVCQIVSIEPDLACDLPIRTQLAQWLEALSSEQPKSDLAIILAGQTSDFRRELREAIGLAYFGLGEDQTAFSLLVENQSPSTGGLFARATLWAQQGDIEHAQNLYDLGASRIEEEKDTELFELLQFTATNEIVKAKRLASSESSH